MTFKLGLTGSIGMGKSTTAQMFAEAGCAVWDADAAVHRLYSRGGAAVALLRDVFPEAIVDGAVSRDALKLIVANRPEAWKTLEAIVHPLVAADRAAFIEASYADIVVSDIPLLFETGADSAMDAVVVVTVGPEQQKTRVMARPGMTEEQFNIIQSKQMADADKRARADYVIETDTQEHAREQVAAVIADIRQRMADA